MKGRRSNHRWLILTALVLSHVVYTSASTQSLWNHPSFKKKAVETTQKLMLSALGLTEFPRPGSKMIPHKYMIDLYDKLASGEHDGSNVKTVHAFTDQEWSDSSSILANHQSYVYNLSALPAPGSEHVLSTDIRILRQASGRKAGYYIEKHGTDYLVAIYSKPVNYTLSLLSYQTWKPLDSFSFDIRDRKEKWNTLRVKSAAEPGQQKTVEFLICVRSRKSGALVPPEDVGFSRDGRAHDERALLVVFLLDKNVKPVDQKSKENKRTSNATQLDVSAENGRTDNASGPTTRARRRRDSGSLGDNTAPRRSRTNRGRSRRKRKKENCRRKPLYVNFSNLGWSNWVIAPEGYNAYYCEGLCAFPIADHYKPTNHAVVQTIVNSVKPSLAPKVCCIPNKLSAISILYVDSSNNLVYKKYEEMVVERCGCN